MSTRYFHPHEIGQAVGFYLRFHVSSDTTFRMGVMGCEGKTGVEYLRDWFKNGPVYAQALAARLAAYGNANEKAVHVAYAHREGMGNPTISDDFEVRIDLAEVIKIATATTLSDTEKETIFGNISMLVYNLDNEANVEALTFATDMMGSVIKANLDEIRSSRYKREWAARQQGASC